MTSPQPNTLAATAATSPQRHVQMDRNTIEYMQYRKCKTWLRQLTHAWLHGKDDEMHRIMKEVHGVDWVEDEDADED